jgi:hypothetical protein
MLEFQPDGTPIAVALRKGEKATGPLWLAHAATCPDRKRKRQEKRTRKPTRRAERQTTLKL